MLIPAWCLLTGTCPTGRAYGDLPTGTKRAHAPAECSNNGLCNRLDGFCMCYAGFVGFACQRRTCPSECSGHGQCKSMQELAAKSDALPLSNVTKYYGKLETTTWDVGTSYGCFCDSGWSVGLGDGETQTPEWFGPDCSERKCVIAVERLRNCQASLRPTLACRPCRTARTTLIPPRR